MKRILILCLALLIVATGCTTSTTQPSPAQISENPQPTTTSHESNPPEQSDLPSITEKGKWSIAAGSGFAEQLRAAGLSEEDVNQMESILQDYFYIHAVVLVGDTPEISDRVPVDIAEHALNWASAEYARFRSDGIYIIGCKIEYDFKSVQDDPSTGKYTLCVREYIYEDYNRTGNINDPTDTMGTAMNHEFTFLKTDSGSMSMIGQSDDWVNNGS